MTKQCRSCKREIAKGQSVCYICGSKQSFISHHIVSILFTFGLIGTVSAASYWYIEQSSQQSILDSAKIIESIKSESSQKLQDLQLALDQANQALELAKTNAAQASNAATDTNLKTQEIEERAKKAESRATWLSKENRRFKNKVKELNDKISDMQKSNTTINANQAANSISSSSSQSSPVEQSGNANLPASDPQTELTTENDQSADSTKQASSDEPTPPDGE